MTNRHQLITKHHRHVEGIVANINVLEQVILETTLEFIASSAEVYVVHCNSKRIVDHIQRGERYQVVVKHPCITAGSYLPLGEINGRKTVFKATANGMASCFIQHGNLSVRTDKESHALLMIRRSKDYVGRVEFPTEGFYYRHIQIRMDTTINILGETYSVYNRLLASTPVGVSVFENIIFNLAMKVKRQVRSKTSAGLFKSITEAS